MKNNIPATEIKDNYSLEILKSFKSENKKIKTNKPKNLSEFDNKWNMNNRIIKLFEDSISKDQKLKEKYAITLIVILIIQLIILNIIFCLVGKDILKYSETTFNIFITGGIAEIFVLVKVIVKYLFKDNLSSALNIILENNNKIKNKTNNKNKKFDKP